MDFLGACFFRSLRIYFVSLLEDKLHLGKFIQTSLMPLHSICIIFVKKEWLGGLSGIGDMADSRNSFYCDVRTL